MRDFASLKLLDRTKRLFAAFGVDYPIMRRMLQVKLTMDSRRVPTVIAQTSNKKKEADTGGPLPDVNYFIRSLWLYALLGLILVPFVVMGDNYMFQAAIVFGMFMFLIATSMISDFSSVLLDLRDKSILHTKPVHPRTIHAARTVHILIYLSFLTAALAGPSLLAGAIRHGLAFLLLFLIEVVLANMLIVVLTALLYIVLLRLFDGEKLKDMINYVQILLSLVIAVGYQVVARSFEWMELQVNFLFQWWHVFVPPIWFAAPFELLLHGDRSAPTLLLTVLAVLIPVLAMLLYGKLIPVFERNLQKLADQGAMRASRKSRFADRAARLLCRTSEERTFFRFTLNMLKGEREFKLKTYPSVGFSIIFPFIFLYSAFSDMSWEDFSGSRSYITIYFSGMLIPTVAYMMKFSGTYKGAWIYGVAPVSHRQVIVTGVLKAALLRLFAPVFAALAVIFAALFGLRILPDLVAVLLAMLLYAYLCFNVFNRELPFSHAFEGATGGGGVAMFGLVLLIVAFALAHVAITFIPFGAWGYALLLLAANWFVWRRRSPVAASSSKNAAM
ncbi:hypothetical protein [Paenibacillus methanolicus]|uniref:ABC-2 type transport system permease protein n=1 Tax=Paenibacillus methanolicus TaxID=582686 RepID=A0A5S5C237_9BACL|nr:hypothetical protein [Paenibacillus methanolicus]TYP72033.1 hypothetical protein BCM02_109312 [Paenibacillus methanolicus]